jgi:hypothetical protein
MHWLVVALLVMVLIVIGCENSVGPGAEGQAQGVVRDRPQQTSAKVSGTGAAGSATAFTGDLTGNMFVSFSADGDTWVDLGSPNGITVKLQSTTDSTNVHGEQDVEAASYTRVRLVMQNAQATLKAGSTIGSLTLTSDTVVKVGGSDQQVVIERTVSFQVSSDTDVRTATVFELNAEQWMTEQAVQAGVAEDAAIQQATTVAVRSEAR